MGQESYLIRTGVGFDVDRRSGQEAIGYIESMAETMNTKAMVKSVNGIKGRNKALINLNKELEEKNQKATDKRKKKVEQAAKATHQSIMKSLPPLDESKLKTPKTGKKTAEYKRYLKQIDGMSKAHTKFAERASAAGIKMKKAMQEPHQGKKVGVDSQAFGKQGAEDRQRQINLMKQMIDENKELIALKGKGADDAKADNIHLEKQAKALIAIDKDAIQVEKKEAKIKKKNANQYRKDARKLHQQNKQEMQDIKTRAKMYQDMGRKAAGWASGISSGMKNAFVIGTAAAGAFAYKLQPVVEQVMEFEKTIINANSVFRESNEVLHEVSDSLVQFGLQYGISTEKSAEGLYQLASAGLSAAESQEVLRHTLLLSMATQGDHNTLAKLTVQTIAGFGMEMSMAGELTDKFAHTIQKSLVEWQDLASSVKFAMPFFVATGQSIDHLLGGIEVLSNRALEAGIAGRGLRQSLAQLTKHAEDNESAFAKLGIATMGADGNMRELTDIVQDAKAAFGDVTDLQALTIMLEDMNVRGATAFALLVQNADEYTDAVNDLANSAGEATAMADVQQESLSMQIQKVKNALMAPFLFSDKIGEANNTLNVFTLRIKEIVDEFVTFFIEGEKGAETVTEFGYKIRDFVVVVMTELLDVVRQLKETFATNEGLDTFGKLLDLAVKPMQIMLKVLDRLSPNVLTWLVYMKVANKLLPINTIVSLINSRAMMTLALATGTASGAKMTYTSVIFGETLATYANNVAHFLNNIAIYAKIGIIKLLIASKLVESGTISANTLAWVMNSAAMMAGIVGIVILAAGLSKVMSPIAALTTALVIGAIAWAAYNNMMTMGVASVGMIAGAAATIAVIHSMFPKEAAGRAAGGASGKAQGGNVTGVQKFDTGGRYNPTYYDSGGLTQEHGMAVLQKGETVVSRSQNAAGGSEAFGGGGTSIIIQGDVYDAEKFTEKISQVLPGALRNSNDIGAI